MTKVWRAFLTSALLLGELLAGEDAEEWLPAPDGFVWPAMVKDAPVFKPVERPTRELPASIRAAVFDEKVFPERVAVCEVDLNVDGKPELLVEIGAYGGTGGAYYEIFSAGKAGSYRSIGSFQGGVRFCTRKDGWYQIQVSSRVGGGMLRSLLTFQRGQYRDSRREKHDFSSGTVTVRN
jgi:hypothetical protein